MALLPLRRTISLTSLLGSHLLSKVCCFCSMASSENKTNARTTASSIDKKQIASANYSSKIHLSPLFSSGGSHSDGYDIELVDSAAWQVSSSLSHAWRGMDCKTEARHATESINEDVSDVASSHGDSDFDEIDNMRIRGNLFYKIDRRSKEFEEYSFDFHRKKSKKRKDFLMGNEKQESSKEKGSCREPKKEESPRSNSDYEVDKLPQVVKNGRVYSLRDNVDSSDEKKKTRTATFNQLTAPYHEPFCLDIYISKASVRACVIHRVTSKVVAVAHSISKDMKFDLPSTKNAGTCAAVGRILAQRALADDIHDAVYTPRKGERLEGKLQIVLQSIIDNGVNVKVKLKQQNRQKAGFRSTA